MLSAMLDVALAAAAKPFDASQAAGAVLGGVLGVPALMGLVAKYRDPMRSRAAAPPAIAPWAPPGSVLDVTVAAKQLKRRAQYEFYAQMLGVSLVLDALLPISPGARVGCVLAGLALCAGVIIRRSHGRAGVAPVFWTLEGRRPARVMTLFVVGNLSAALGAVCVVFAAIQDSDGGDTSAAGPISGVAAILFVIAAVCVRRARRLSSVTAHELLARDRRPMVLYLRAFGDDSLRLRTATLGRRTLLERLSPNRFDVFEEVLVRHLTDVGPVVAINPPGTRLAPIGAARETIPTEAWQTQVHHWLRTAALVVIAAPPGAISAGVVWELQQIGAVRQWRDTLVVVPPVPDDQLRLRWQALRSAAPPMSWPFDTAPPADPASSFVMSFQHGGWRAAVAEERDEWSYLAALTVMGRAAAPSG